MTEISADIRERLALLRQEYLRQLPEKIQDIRRVWAHYLEDAQGSERLSALYRMVHSLSGSGATFGCETISQTARRFEIFLKQLIESNQAPSPLQQEQARSYITALELSLHQVQQNSALSHAPGESTQAQPTVGTPGSRLVFLVDDDPYLAAQLDANVRQYGYEVRTFTQLGSMHQALREAQPVAIIMDMVFPEGDLAGAEAIQAINDQRAAPIPVIFISVRDDFISRLTAVRTGSTHYFTKPLDIPRMIRTLDELIAKRPRVPYRILIVDDDAALAAVYRLHLEEAGMQVEVVNNPLHAIAVLHDFKPDLMLLDVFMPECSGMELASVIRQQECFSGIPIIFLSTESDQGRQLTAINLGGDEFLTKPIESWRLIRSVEARVKRAREMRLGNERLHKLVRELEYQKFALDQHAIVSIANARGEITYVNEKFVAISQYTETELIGKNHRIVNSGFHDRAFFQQLWQTITAGRVWRCNIQNRSKNGTLYWVATTVVPYLNEEGKPYQFVSISTDITHIKLTEERFRRGQNYANIGTWDWNVQNGEMFWSERIAPLLGYAEEAFTASYDHFLSAVHPDDRQSVADSITACVEHGSEYDIEHRIVRPDGTTIWVKESGDVVRAADNTPLRMLGVVQDITRSKLAEEDALRARDEAEHANHAKSEFLAHMSHELRTPLNAILGFGQLMESDPDDSPSASQRENIAQILKAGWHLLDLVNDVLNLAKIESGNIDLMIENTPLAEVIAECIGTIRPLADQRGISILDDACDCTFCVVHADRTRLKQVLLNLLSNAIKYNREQGSITLLCSIPQSGRLRIDITDQGPGLSATQQAHLFQPFNRLGAENSTVQGTGIGLIIARHMIELMGGKIGVESEPGQGCTFWVELNLGQNLTPQSDMQPTTDLPAARSKARHSALYVEDNPANLKLVAQILTKHMDIDLNTAHTGELGLELARQHCPELIILDINLPGMDGIELRKQLLLHEETRHIPVIALSANALPRDIDNAIKAGFQDYITKPIEIEKLLAAVSKALLGKVSA